MGGSLFCALHHADKGIFQGKKVRDGTIADECLRLTGWFALWGCRYRDDRELHGGDRLLTQINAEEAIASTFCVIW